MPWPQLSTALPRACGIPGESAQSRRWVSARIIKILALACILFSIEALRGPAYGQSSAEPANADTARGIQLYNQGDLKEAAKALRAAVKNHNDDARAWFYLGLALTRTGDVRRARSAFEETLKLRPDNADALTGLAYTLLLANKSSQAEREATRALELDGKNVDAYYIVAVTRLRAAAPFDSLDHIEAALQFKPNYPAALLLKSQILMNLFTDEAFKSTGQTKATRLSWLLGAMESLEKFLKLSPGEPGIEVWREQFESLGVYAELADKSNPNRSVFQGSEVDQKLRILKKTEPQYTEEARGAGVQGKVDALAIMSVDGTVKHILLLQRLSHGLTEQSIRAARNIKFEPAIKDGRPVSQVVRLEYNFHLF